MTYTSVTPAAFPLYHLKHTIISQIPWSSFIYLKASFAFLFELGFPPKNMASYELPKMSTGCLFSHDSLSTKLRDRVGVLLAPHSYFPILMLFPSQKEPWLNQAQEYIIHTASSFVICQPQGQSQSFFEEFNCFTGTHSNFLLPCCRQCQYSDRYPSNTLLSQFLSFFSSTYIASLLPLTSRARF